MLQESLLQVQGWRAFKPRIWGSFLQEQRAVTIWQPCSHKSGTQGICLRGLPNASICLQLKPLPITWYLLAAEHVHGVHALIIYALWTRIMFSSIFRKLTSNYILACSIICGPNFSSLKLFIISNLKNYRFAIFWCLSSVFSWHCLQSPLEGKVALSLPFVISYRWLHVLLQGS